MAHHVFRKGGVPALASDHTNPASFSCLCSLVVKVDVARRRATVTLEHRLPLHGFDTDQNVSSVYDADNIIPGETRIASVNLPPLQSQKVARNDGKDLRSLIITLRKPCTILSPQLRGSLAPQAGSEHPFEQLVALAKATHLCIVFDYAWVHPNKAAQFLSLVDTSAYAGFPRGNTAGNQTDWTVFAPGESALLDDLPSYAKSSRKRPQPSRSSSPQTLPPKRRLVEPDQPNEPPSPTEKATTTASPSPRLAPSSPLGGPFDIQEAVESAVAKLLPDALRVVLTDVLAQLLPIDQSILSTPQVLETPPDPMSLLRKLIRNHMNAHADELAQQVTTDLRDIATVELQEQLDDHRIDIAMLKEDGLTDINRFCDEKLQELNEHSAEILEAVGEDTLDAFNIARDKFDEFVGKQRRALRQELCKTGTAYSMPRARRSRSLPPVLSWL